MKEEFEGGHFTEYYLKLLDIDLYSLETACFMKPFTSGAFGKTLNF